MQSVTVHILKYLEEKGTTEVIQLLAQISSTRLEMARALRLLESQGKIRKVSNDTVYGMNTEWDLVR